MKYIILTSKSRGVENKNYYENVYIKWMTAS